MERNILLLDIDHHHSHLPLSTPHHCHHNHNYLSTLVNLVNFNIKFFCTFIFLFLVQRGVWNWTSTCLEFGIYNKIIIIV
jgi:hypothetical protein